MLHNKKLLITLIPERIVLKTFGREPLLHEESVAPSSDVLVCLDALLAQPQWQRYQVQIVLSNRYVKYMLQTVDAQLQDVDARMAWVQHQISQLYGEQQWVIRVQDFAVGQPSLICAVAQTLVDELRLICSRHKLNLVSIMPLLAKVMNRHQAPLKLAKSAWLVIHESTFSQLVLLQQGQIVSVSSGHHHHISMLTRLLDQENLVAPLAEACKTVFIHSATAASEFTASNYQVEWLQRASTKPPKMNWLQLDFLQPSQTHSWAGWLLFIAGLALCVEMLFSYSQLQMQLEALPDESQIVKANQKRKPSNQNIAQSAVMSSDTMLRRLQMPWGEFFAGLESIQTEQAVILSLQHNQQTNQFYMEGEAKDYASLLALINELNRTKPFANVVLQQHQIKIDDPNRPLQFTLVFTWVTT